MAKKQKRAPRIIPTEKQKVTWGEVCKTVGFRDNLYKTCRDKVPGFTGTGLSQYDLEEDEFQEDFGKMLRKSAQDIPPPPPEDWKEEGFLEGLMENKGRLIVYGGLAALVYWFLLRPKLAALLASMSSAPAATAPAAQKPIVVSSGTTAKAA